MTAIDFVNHHRPLKLRVEDFLALNDSGAFEGYGKTELLDGEIVYMNAQHRPHARVKATLSRAIDDALRSAGSRLTVLTEVTISAPPHDAPEPDIVVTSEPDGEGPVPLASVCLVVEVADATLATDMKRKAKIYALHGVPEYWVADVNARKIIQMWMPVRDAYANHASHAYDEPFDCHSIAGLRIGTETLGR
jgi:Uma2 family endonuclease